MNEKQRKKNEAEFDSWIETANGGRVYFFEVSGKLNWKAKYLKEVDSDEITIKFWQEVYDEQNLLEKFMKNIQLIKDIKKLNNDYKKNIADQLLAYLQHGISLTDLVGWAELNLMNGSYHDDNHHTIRNALSQLALADVKAFGLEWKDCENIMKTLGFKLEVKALEVA